MGLHMMQAAACGLRKSPQCAGLIEHDLVGLFLGDRHIAPAKPHQIRQPRMGANGNTMFYRQLDRSRNGSGITRMKTTCDIRAGKKWHQRRIVAHFPGTKALSNICIQINCFCHCCNLRSTAAKVSSNDRCCTRASLSAS